MIAPLRAMARWCAAIAIGLGMWLALPAHADQHWQNSCSEDDYEACLHLSEMYKRGTLIFPKDPARAQQLFDTGVAGFLKTCQSDNPFTCDDTAFLFHVADFDMIHGNALRAQIYQALERHCASGSRLSCLTLSESVFKLAEQAPDGQRLLSDEDLGQTRLAFETRAQEIAREDVKNLEHQCQAGDHKACTLVYVVRGALLGDRSAYEELKDAFAQLCIGTRQDTCLNQFEFQVSLFRIQPELTENQLIQLEGACDLDRKAACLIVGLSRQLQSLHNGDYPFKSSGHLEKACDLDVPLGCARTAARHLHIWQSTPEPDPALLLPAVEAFTRACDLGEITSCHYLEHISEE